MRDGVVVAFVVLVALLAGCAEAPDVPAAVPNDAEGGGATSAGRVGRTAETSYSCEGSQGFAVGTGQGFLAGTLANLCPDVGLRSPDGDAFRSGRLVMAWTQPAPTLVDAYVELSDGGEVLASGTSPTSPVVVEFQVDETTSIDGRVYYGGTGAGVALEVTITLEMFVEAAPPPLA